MEKLRYGIIGVGTQGGFYSRYLTGGMGPMPVGFEKVYLMQNNLNKSTSEIISTYVYYIGMVSGTGDFSYSTAIDLFNAVINLTLLILVNTVSKKVGETSLW